MSVKNCFKKSYRSYLVIHQEVKKLKLLVSQLCLTLYHPMSRLWIPSKSLDLRATASHSWVIISMKSRSHIPGLSEGPGSSPAQGVGVKVPVTMGHAGILLDAVSRNPGVCRAVVSTSEPHLPIFPGLQEGDREKQRAGSRAPGTKASGLCHSFQNLWEVRKDWLAES